MYPPTTKKEKQIQVVLFKLKMLLGALSRGDNTASLL